jgi:hypothetical protein
VTLSIRLGRPTKTVLTYAYSHYLLHWC